WRRRQPRRLAKKWRFDARTGDVAIGGDEHQFVALEGVHHLTQRLATIRGKQMHVVMLASLAEPLIERLGLESLGRRRHPIPNGPQTRCAVLEVAKMGADDNESASALERLGDEFFTLGCPSRQHLRVAKIPAAQEVNIVEHHMLEDTTRGAPQGNRVIDEG